MELKFIQQRHDWKAHFGSYGPALWSCTRCGVGYFGNAAQWLGECPGPKVINPAKAQAARVGEGVTP